MTNTKRTPESMGQDLARDIEAFANALEAAGIKGPHVNRETGTLSIPLAAMVVAHNLLNDPRSTQPPSVEEIRKVLTSTLG